MYCDYNIKQQVKFSFLFLFNSLHLLLLQSIPLAYFQIAPGVGRVTYKKVHPPPPKLITMKHSFYI